MHPDPSPLVATQPDSDFTLSIEEALARYAEAGLPRTPRSVQRYCALGHLEARRVDTQFGEKWLITPASIDRHIAYIKEVTPATSRDLSRPAEASRDVTRTDLSSCSTEEPADDQQRQAPTLPDQSRPAATPPDTDRYVSRLESENEFLRGQVVVKDGQIKELTERARETNLLIGGLQKMLTPLLGSRRGSAAE